MRTFVLALMISLPPVGAAAQDAASAPAGLRWFDVEARVEVNTKGDVVSVQPRASAGPAIDSLLQSTVSRWRFAPPMRDGVAVSGVTFVRLMACVAPTEGQQGLAFSYRGNGPARLGSSVSPRISLYLRDNQSVKLTVDYRVLADGRAELDEFRFDSRVGAAAGGAIRSEVLAWLKQARFEPEQLDGKPVVTRVRMPMEVSRGASGNRAQVEAQTKRDDARRQSALAGSPACQAAMKAQPATGGEVAMDSPFSLLSQG